MREVRRSFERCRRSAEARPMSMSLLAFQDIPKVNSFSEAFSQMDVLTHPDKLLESLSKMPLALASVVVVVGALCVVNGYKWHKWVVIALAFLLGLFVGNILSQQM